MSSTDIVVVLNPGAGRRRAVRQEHVLQHLLEQMSRRTGLRWRIVRSAYAGHAAELARQAALDGASIVVAAGGDGTCGEVAGGLVGTHARLGILPLGTGNDFARCVGIPEDLQIAVENLFTGKPRRIDLGLVENAAGKRYFINIAGCGFDAAVAHRVNRGFPFLRGTAAYVAAVLQTIVTFQPVSMRIRLDDHTVQHDALLCSVANAQYYGGGMRIAPFAQVDDGWLDVCIVRAVHKLEFVRMFPRVFSGTHITHPHFLMYRAKQVHVESTHPVPVLIDGDVVGTTPVQFYLHPGAIEAILPAK
ncbi:MAG: diacylglycerol kinase family lipid kinase [bacterium]|nr:diacylglycerol kinase family lipid kinase [bacterium]MDW8104862.1 diacylglycerol kinase family lipid kinase [Armatimonadota bacterium]